MCFLLCSSWEHYAYFLQNIIQKEKGKNLLIEKPPHCAGCEPLLFVCFVLFSGNLAKSTDRHSKSCYPSVLTRTVSTNN